MKVFSKIIASFLAIILCLCAYSSLLFSASAVESNTVSSANFYKGVQQMIDDYGLVEEGMTNSISNNTNRVIVKTNSNAKIDALNSIASVEGFNNWHIFQFETSQDTEDALEYYNRQDYVEYVEEDFTFLANSSNLFEEDPVFDIEPTRDDYGCVIVNSKSAIDKVSSNGNLNEVIVAVFDTGLSKNHSYFDYSRIIDSEESLFGSDTDDVYGHGTHVAGIIYNNTPSNVKISPYKVISDYNTGSLISIALTIPVAVDNGVDVINMSLGKASDVATYLTFKDAVSYANEREVPVIVAAGNKGQKLTAQIPAILEECITVSSVDENGQPSEFSNYGSPVDIAAPGEKINSAIPYENKMEENEKECDGHYYATISGTSMSTPFVTAAVALLLSVDPNLTVSDVETILKQTANVPNDWDSDYGVGIVDFSNMLSIHKTKSPKIELTSDGAIITASSNAQIYYTTDGSTPVVGESALYSGTPIKTSSVSTIKAIAYEEGQLPSEISTQNLRWSVDATVYYKGTAKLSLPADCEIKQYYSSDKDVVTVDENGNITGISAGDATVTIFFDNNVKVTYNVSVEYDWWQKLIIVFLFGFLWYI